MKIKTIISPFLPLLLLFAHAPSLFSAPLKSESMNACFITINSSEEKHLFKKELSTGKNKGKFKFYELTPMRKKHNYGWFEQACRKNIRCDILVISGHFGGNFFGSSGLDLNLNQLEKRSCKNDCKEIMSSPKEVFLLGCNTLAGKREDNRSAAEYLNVLIADDIPVDQAARIVEQRYGAIGTSFKNTMKRVFKGVPHIYGFHSVGPSGKNIKPLLKKYHRRIPNYYDHLLKIEIKRGLALMGDFTKWNRKNRSIRMAMKGTNFSQTSGLLIPCIPFKNHSSNFKSYSIRENICKLRSGLLSNEESFSLIRSLLLGEDFSLYLPVIGEYIEQYYFQNQFSNLLTKYPQIKEKILALLEKSQTRFGKLKIAKTALSLSILSKKDFKKIERKAILSYLTPPISTGARDALCSYQKKGKIALKASDLKNSLFSDTNGLLALKCLNINDKEIISKILNVAKHNKSSRVRTLALSILVNAKIKNPKLISFLKRQLRRAKTKNEKAFALYALATLEQGNSLIYKKIKSMMKSKRIIQLPTRHTSENLLALFSLRTVQLKNYLHFKEFFKFWKKQHYKGEEVKLAETHSFASALGHLQEKEVLKFLKDKSLTTKKEKDNIIKSLFAYYFNDNKKKVPFELYLYSTRKYLNDNNDEILPFFTDASLRNEKEAKALLSLLKKKRPSEEQKKNLILNFPQEIDSPSLMKYLVKEYRRNPSLGNTIGFYLMMKKKISKTEKEVLSSLKETKNSILKVALKEHKIN